MDAIHWIFGEGVCLAVVLFAWGLGVTFGVSTTGARDVRLGHVFFAIGFLWSAGCTMAWLSHSEIGMRAYFYAFIAGGSILSLWLASYRWVEGNHKKQIAVQVAGSPLPSAAPKEDVTPPSLTHLKRQHSEPHGPHSPHNPVINQQGQNNIAQVGNNNQAVINERKTLIFTPSEALLIQQAMSKYRGRSIDIFLHQPTPETEKYRDGLVEALRNAGLLVTTMKGTAFHPTPDPGINFAVGPGMDDCAKALADIFVSEKQVEMPISRVNVDKDNWLSIIIAPPN